MSIYMLELYQYNIFPLCFYVISNSLKQCKALAPTILHWDIPLKFNDCPNNLILNHSLHWSPCFFSLSLSEIIPQGFFDLSSLKFLKNIGHLFCEMPLNLSLTDVSCLTDASCFRLYVFAGMPQKWCYALFSAFYQDAWYLFVPLITTLTLTVVKVISPL